MRTRSTLIAAGTVAKAALGRVASLGLTLFVGCGGLPALADSLPDDSPDTARVREALETMAAMKADGHLKAIRQRVCLHESVAHAECLVANARLAKVVEIRDQLERRANVEALEVLHDGVAQATGGSSACDVPTSSLTAARRAVLLHLYALRPKVDVNLEIEGEPGPCFEVPTLGGEVRPVPVREHRGELPSSSVRLRLPRPFEPDRHAWVTDELDGRPELTGARIVVVALDGVCGELCGQGEDHAVALVGGRWLYLGSRVTWMS